MFGKLKNAYAALVGAILDHAATFRAADAKVRAFYGLDEPPQPVNVLPSTAETPAREPEPTPAVIVPPEQPPASAEATAGGTPRKPRAARSA